ncbi:MAG: MoaD/ThiS family protein, partial [Promethearchaeota archaeon]
MIIEVLYFAEFKDITGKEKEKFDLSGSTLEGLLSLLFDKYELKKLIWDEKNQEIHSLISIIINNQAIHKKDPSLINL